MFGTFGTGLGHSIPLVAYLGFWIMCLVSLGWRPLYGLYYSIPFLTYRSMRDHFNGLFMGEHLLIILLLCVVIGAVMRGKNLPKSMLYAGWLILAVYLYLSLWLGAALGHAPLPLWLDSKPFVNWKDYMTIPLVFVAAGLVVEDRKAIRNVVLIIGMTLLVIDRSSLMESMQHTWGKFDESKRDNGPLVFGSNLTGAYLAQFALFFWGFLQFLGRMKARLLGYLLVAITLFAIMYVFSRGAYLCVVAGVAVLGIVKNRGLLAALIVAVVMWQTILPTAVQQRISMTRDENGQLDLSAQERVDLWQESWEVIKSNSILGIGFGSYDLMPHVHGLGDTHNVYVKITEETGLIGLGMTLMLIGRLMWLGFGLFRYAEDHLYKGLGLGLFLAVISCVVANCFGDRWTYVEVSGPLWVLAAAATRAQALCQAGSEANLGAVDSVQVASFA
jgi:putative inorganic carbon (hco3(-)) transporter